MRWLIPIGIGVVSAAAAIIKALDSEAGAERERWSQRYQATQRDIERHRQNIEDHLHEAQLSYDFRLLIDLHFSSMKAADEAHKLLAGAHTSISAILNALISIKEKISHITEQRNSATNYTTRKTMSEEIDGLRKLRSSLFEDKDAIAAQRQNFLSEVKRLNNQTRLLKEAIRDRTGSRGIEWHQRYLARKAAKRATAI